MGKQLSSGKGAFHVSSGKEASLWERSFPVGRELPSVKRASQWTTVRKFSCVKGASGLYFYGISVFSFIKLGSLRL